MRRPSSSSSSPPMLSSVLLLLVPVLLLLASPSLVSGRVSPRLDAPLCSTSVAIKGGGGHVTVSTGEAGVLAGAMAAGVTVQLDAWGDDSIRIRVSPDAIVQIPYVQALLPFPPGLTPPLPQSSSPCRVSPSHRKRSSAAAELTNGNIAVSVGTDGQVTVTRGSDGVTLVQTTAVSFNPVNLSSIYNQSHSLYQISVAYTHANGKIFGSTPPHTHTSHNPPRAEHNLPHPTRKVIPWHAADIRPFHCCCVRGCGV